MKSSIFKALAVLLLTAGGADAQTGVHRFGRVTMGTWGEILLAGPDSVAVAPLAESAFRRFLRVDTLMSNWNPKSELSRANELAAHGCALHGEIAPVLEAALAIGHASGGAFDITVEPLVRLWGFLGGEPRVPDPVEIQELLPRIGLKHIRYDAERRWLRFDQPDLRIDLGGIAKGHAVDLAWQSLRDDRAEGALINLSGNMRAVGSPPHREHWVVGLRDPSGPMESIASLRLEGEAIATSGNYEQFVARDGTRYGHILDPRSGWPAQELSQVTVLAPTAMEADAWATALFVMGSRDAASLLAERQELHGILLRPDGPGRWQILCCEHLMDRLTLLPEAATRFEILPL